MVVPAQRSPLAPAPESRSLALDVSSTSRHDRPVARRPAHRRPLPRSPAARREDALIRMLYDQHATPLLMFVQRLTRGDRQRAEDIVQETLMRAWRNAHKLGAAGQTSIRPWLVTVARRIAIDNHRSDSVRPTETYDQELDSFAIADETEQVLRSMTVSDALRSLSYAHREILLETFFRGRTVPEAADVLGLPLGTAKSRVYYALRALRSALEQRGVTS
ncbi:MAG: sigma-70 family RNA polymerase sigma factor [Micromonosporaceae bacterium]|nr:sigma-70 family RNA polymerase sigma factor [Micromonosporaceae bacterium]